MTEESSTVRAATLAVLRDLGMTTVFGNPGSTELPMFRDFPGDFRYVLGLQESVVLAMADGYAQATRNAALVNLHSAAGVGHALGNLFTAYKNQTPLVVTAGQQARSILSYEPFLFAERAAEFPQPYVKWSCEPASAQAVPAAIARAYHVAMQPPRGPTFVSIPVDDWDMPCAMPTTRRVSQQTQGDTALLDEVAAALGRARRPALVLGAGVARDEAWEESIALAERHSAAVWVAPFSARNSFPERHPLFAGFLVPMRERIVEALEPFDVIIVIGGPLSLYHVEGSGPHAPPASTLFLLTDNPAVAAWAPVGTAIVTSARAGIDALSKAVPSAEREPFRTTPPAPPLPPELTDAFVLQQISRLRPRGSVIVEEAPSSRGAMHERLPIDDPDGFYTCASGGLGHGLPAAVGVALARPHDKVIAILGDGSAMYAIQGLWSAAQNRLPISFLILNNRRYEALIGFGRHFGLRETQGTLLPGLDFCALAQGQGISARRVSSVDELDSALAASFAATGPTLLQIDIR